MQTFSKIIIALFILVAAGIIYLAFPVIKSRYFTEEPSSQQSERNQDTSSIEKTEETTEGSQAEETVDSEEIDENSAENEAVRNDTFVEITKADCENECKNFEEEEDATYCKQVCGLVILEERNGCDNLEDLEKDYCLKDSAIEKTDAKICEQIDDKNIRTTCKNRIMEDIIDKQNESRSAEPF